MFTASLPPEVIAATGAALEDMIAQPELRRQLMDNAAQLHAGFTKLGLNASKRVSPVIAVTLETVEQAIPMWNRLLELGVYVNLSLPPATPDSRPLLRCSVMATHTAAQIDQALAIFGKAAVECGVPLQPEAA
jgi:8-amino-7-oxononanoate synthase